MSHKKKVSIFKVRRVHCHVIQTHYNTIDLLSGIQASSK